LKGVVSIGLLYCLTTKMDVSHVAHVASTIQFGFLSASIALMIFQLALGGVRWDIVLRAMASGFPAKRALTGYFIGNFFSQVLPGAIAGDAVRMWFARKENLPLSASINSVLLERGITVLGLVLMVAALQPFFLSRMASVSGTSVAGTWVFPVLAMAGIVGTIGLCMLDRLPSHWRRWKIVRGLAQLAVDSRRVFVRSRCGMFALLIAFVGHVNLSLSGWMLARGLNIHVSAFDCMVLIPPVTLIMILPVSIAGWGVRETAMVTAFGYVGVPGDSALALSILFGLVSLAASFPGGLCFLAARECRETSLRDIVVAPHDIAVDFFEDAETAKQLSEAA
jgi:hypothetical protein